MSKPKSERKSRSTTSKAVATPSKSERLTARMARDAAALAAIETEDKTDANISKLLVALGASKRIVGILAMIDVPITLTRDDKGKLTAKVRRAGSGGTKSPSPLKAVSAVDVSVNGKKIGSTSVSRVMAAIAKVDPKNAKRDIYKKDSPVRVAQSPEWLKKFRKANATVHLPDGKTQSLAAILETS